MPAETANKFIVPINPAEDVLERVVRAALIAESFKKLVLDLAVDDVSDELGDLEDLCGNPDYVDPAGNILTDANILSGEYVITPSRAAEVNPVNYISAEVSLTTIEGGRDYILYTSTALDIPLSVRYSETPGHRNTLNVLAQFSVESDGQRERDKIPFWQLIAVDGLTSQVRKLMQTKRMRRKVRDTAILPLDMT